MSIYWTGEKNDPKPQEKFLPAERVWEIDSSKQQSSQSHTRTKIHIHTHTHKNTHIHTQTNTHTHKQTHTHKKHTHIYKHTQNTHTKHIHRHAPSGRHRFPELWQKHALVTAWQCNVEPNCTATAWAWAISPGIVGSGTSGPILEVSRVWSKLNPCTWSRVLPIPTG